MKTIYKYPLKVTDQQSIKMPRNFQILSIQYQRSQLYLWALVEGEEVNNVIFNIYGTGHPLPCNPGEFLATIQQDNGNLVWHIFRSYNEPS